MRILCNRNLYWQNDLKRAGDIIPDFSEGKEYVVITELPDSVSVIDNNGFVHSIGEGGRNDGATDDNWFDYFTIIND